MAHRILFVSTLFLFLPLQGWTTTDWLTLARQVLGPQAGALDLMDLHADEAAVLRAPGDALALVHTDVGFIGGDGEAFLARAIARLGGLPLLPTAAPDTTADGWQHAMHTGWLQGMPVVLDQYLCMAEGRPTRLIRVMRAQHGSAPLPPYTDLRFLRTLMDERSVPDMPAHPR